MTPDLLHIERVALSASARAVGPAASWVSGGWAIWSVGYRSSCRWRSMTGKPVTFASLRGARAPVPVPVDATATTPWRRAAGFAGLGALEFERNGEADAGCRRAERASRIL